MQEHQTNVHEFLFQCHECGVKRKTPYRSYILTLGDCCGVDLLNFCSENCFAEFEKKRKREQDKAEGA